jgi:NAD(P)-dependent dehydrogenase (short-subunit alcohol dehydrogenase family)
VIAADLSTTEGVAAVSAVVREEFGGLDIIVHNAGASAASPSKTFAEVSEEEWLQDLSQPDVSGPSGP